MSKIDVYSPKKVSIINDGIHVAEAQAYCNAKGALRDKLYNCNEVQANTTDTKVYGINYMFRNTAGSHLCVKSGENAQYEEPLTNSAPEAALHKATYLHEKTGKPSAASDIFFYAYDEETGEWKSQHKLGRLKNELSQKELQQEIQTQHRFLVEGRHRRKVFWHPALSLVNGASSEVSDYVCVEFDPFTEKEFEAFMTDAFNTGKFMNSNARGRLMEYIIEFKKLRRYANIPYTFIETHAGNGNRIDVNDWMQEWSDQNDDAVNMLIRQIAQGLPHAVRWMRHRNIGL